MAGGAAQPNANAPVLKKIKMIVPDQESQLKFKSLVEKYEDTKEYLQHQNQLLKESRDLLLPRLMTGMIDVGQVSLPEVPPVPATPWATPTPSSPIFPLAQASAKGQLVPKIGQAFSLRINGNQPFPPCQYLGHIHYALVGIQT